ncbi:hypothetical protein DOLIC_00068 [Dolichomitus sp. PSUC_FEM 10030005]|nr:hypothetical protein [Dolichomitus sp. PSUC_FEM 10030005]
MVHDESSKSLMDRHKSRIQRLYRSICHRAMVSVCTLQHLDMLEKLPEGDLVPLNAAIKTYKSTMANPEYKVVRKRLLHNKNLAAALLMRKIKGQFWCDSNRLKNIDFRLLTIMDE